MFKWFEIRRKGFVHPKESLQWINKSSLCYTGNPREQPGNNRIQKKTRVIRRRNALTHSAFPSHHGAASAKGHSLVLIKFVAGIARRWYHPSGDHYSHPVAITFLLVMKQGENWWHRTDTNPQERPVILQVSKPSCGSAGFPGLFPCFTVATVL